MFSKMGRDNIFSRELSMPLAGVSFVFFLFSDTTPTPRIACEARAERAGGLAIRGGVVSVTARHSFNNALSPGTGWRTEERA